MSPRAAVKKAAPRKAAPRKVAQPGDPNFDWDKEYPAEEYFLCELEDGRVLGLAAVSKQRKLKIGDLRRMKNMNEISQLMVLIERIASPNALAIIDDLDDVEFKAVMDDWTAQMKTSVGESSAP